MLLNSFFREAVIRSVYNIFLSVFHFCQNDFFIFFPLSLSLSLSPSHTQGDDTVFVCAHNSATDRTGLYLHYSDDNPTKSILIPKEDTATNSDSEVICY